MTRTQHAERVRLLALYPVGSVVKWNAAHGRHAAETMSLRVVAVDLNHTHCNRKPWDHNPGCYTSEAVEYSIEGLGAGPAPYRFRAKAGQILPVGLDLDRFVANQVQETAEQAAAAGETYTTADLDEWRGLEIERLFTLAERMAARAYDVERWDADDAASGRAPELCRPCTCGCDLRGRGRRPLAGYLLWKRPGAAIGTTIVFETEAAFLAAARTLSSARAWDHHAIPDGKVVPFIARA